MADQVVAARSGSTPAVRWAQAGSLAIVTLERRPINGLDQIAVINGHTIGDGLSLALACDLRIAAESASFRLPEAAYGFIPGWGTISRLVATVGRAQAAQLLLTRQAVSAARALAIGLVHEVVPADRLVDTAVGQAELMATLSPAALEAAKCVLAGGDEATCFEAIWGGTD